MRDSASAAALAVGRALGLGRLRRWWRSVSARAAGEADSTRFLASDAEEVRHVFFEVGSAAGGPWDRFRHAHMVLPDWFQTGLDPWSEAYAAQQHRLWALVVGVDRAYAVESDEQDIGWESADPIRFPGYYQRRDALAVDSASDHVLATGMLLKHCKLKAGDWALEYGAGFGQTALALARLGVNVDTVDISPRFCDFVRQQAEHFQVPLHPHRGHFGLNPRPGERYQLIWFYESFHHCVDFLQLVPQLDAHLAEGGRIILGGEPIVERANAAVPYPWGVRLHSEVTAVMRQTRWFELGFTEEFLFELFKRAGYAGRRIECEPSLFGRLYVFERSEPTRQ